MFSLNSTIISGALRNYIFIFVLLVVITGKVFAQEVEGKERKPVVILSVDPVGFLTFGPSVSGEIAFNDNFSFAASYRQANLGLITNSLYSDVESAWTVGFALKYHFNNGERFTGFFIGPALEFGKSNYEGEVVYTGLYSSTIREKVYDVLAYGGAIGYKWLFESGFSLEISDLIGVITSKRNDSSYKANEWNVDAYVLYMLSVKLGIAI